MNVSLKQKLQLYKKQLHQAQETENQNRQEKSERMDSDVYEREIRQAARDMSAEIRHFDNESVFVHTEKLELETRIGPYSAGDLFETVSDWQKGSQVHPLSAYGLDADELLFFDTETTGLASGTGQMIFLIGLAHVTSGGVEMKQYFLPGPGHEAAFFNAFLSDSHSLKNLVTFNGKAFDWPRVRTRHQFVRDQVPRLPAFGHFDLLHASRRLWKNRLESVRLQTVEREILGLGREEDVPGKMAPFLYFQFLKQPNAQLVKGIIEHNREDVLSLIALYIHLSNKVLGKVSSDEEERYEIARWYLQIGDDERALPLFRRLAVRDSITGIRSRAQMAALYKREGHYEHALTMLQSVIREDKSPNDHIYIEAAKLMEHQFKKYESAISYTESALEYLRKKLKESADEAAGRKESAYIKRINRLDEKWEREKERSRNRE